MPSLRSRLERFRNKYFSQNGRRVSPQALKYMTDSLLNEAEMDTSFIIMTVSACVIATLGLLSNSTAVIIGAMLIAPLMLPIRSVAFGILEADRTLIRRGMRSLMLGTLLSIALAAFIGRVVNLSEYESEVWARTNPNLLDLGIAIAAGAVAGFAKLDEKISGTLAGTAIAVALMPPLCVVGLFVAKLNLGTALGALLLFATNLLGITLACMLVFLGKGYSPFNRAKRPLGLTIALTSLLLIPLGFTSTRLIYQDRLEAKVRQVLLNNTLTFQRVTLEQLNIDWNQRPAVVNLNVASSTPVTPTQVGLLEVFLEQELGRPFRLEFVVSQVEEVDSKSIRSTNKGTSDRATPAWGGN